MDVLAKLELVLDILRGEIQLVGGVGNVRGRLGEESGATGLVEEVVGARVDDNGVWRLGEERADGELVGSCSRDTKEGGVLACQTCNAGLKGRGIGILELYVVATSCAQASEDLVVGGNGEGVA